MARAAAACAHPLCPEAAVERGRCARHAAAARAEWASVRDSRGVLRGRALQEERERRFLAAKGCCEGCGRRFVLSEFVLHHPTGNLADYGTAEFLCRGCHRDRHRRSAT